MINNKLHKQFQIIDSYGEIIINCYHSTNQLILYPSKIKLKLEENDLHDKRFELLNANELQSILQPQAEWKQISFEFLLSAFLRK